MSQDTEREVWSVNKLGMRAYHSRPHPFTTPKMCYRMLSVRGIPVLAYFTAIAMLQQLGAFLFFECMHVCVRK